MSKVILGFLMTTTFLGINCVAADTSSDATWQTLERTHQLTKKNKAILSEFIEEVWNKGNLDAAIKFISTPYVIHHDPGDPWDGQSLDLPTFKKRVAYSRQIFPDLHFAVQDIIGEVDKVAISWYLEGTHKGDIPGLPAMGKQVKVPGLTIIPFLMARSQGIGKSSIDWALCNKWGLRQTLKGK